MKVKFTPGVEGTAELSDFINLTKQELTVLDNLNELPKTEAEARFRKLPFSEKLAAVQRDTPQKMLGVLIVEDPVLTEEERISLFGHGAWDEARD